MSGLVDVDHIAIEQHVETMEFILGSDAANTYSIKHPSGKLILVAEEFSSLLYRHLVGQSRAFNLKLYNTDQKEVMNAKRRFKISLFGCCSPRCLERMELISPEQDSVGSIVQVGACTTDMHYAVKDEHEEVIFRVRPPQKMIFFSDWVFEVFDAAENNIGEIHKKWAGIGQELFTSADKFEIKFPGSLDLKHKAFLINVCILLVSENRNLIILVLYKFSTSFLSRTLSISRNKYDWHMQLYGKRKL